MSTFSGFIFFPKSLAALYTITYNIDDHVLFTNLVMTSDSEIKGPLGFWTWPLLNALIQISSNNSSKSSNESNDSSKVETAKVIRDSNGEIQEVIVIK